MAKFYTQRELREAIDLYDSFRESSARKINTVNYTLHSLVVAVGYLEYVGYRTTHGFETTLYKHAFAPGSRPLIASSPDGRQLYLLGGRYDFTGRGIVDRDTHGRPIFPERHGTEV